MKRSTPIQLEFSRENFLILLGYGAEPETSPYSHKQIAKWCELFWNKYIDVDASDEIENIMPVLADVETQWDLHLVNSYSLPELRHRNFDQENMPVEWFENWLVEANA